jgi:lysozyme family protein
MANLDLSIQKTLIHEGGYDDNPADPGGATKYGITQKDMPTVNIAELSEQQAVAYYKEHYVKPLYSQIENQDVCDKIFDMGVLFGVGEAVKLLQITLQTAYPNCNADGIFGPETLGFVNSTDSESLLKAYKTSLVTYMLRIVTNRPNLRVFAKGWGTRINS